MGATTLPIYSLCVAHANDQLAPSQIVSASGTLVFALNLGILGGAFAGPAAIGLAGPAGLPALLALLAALTSRGRAVAPGARRGTRSRPAPPSRSASRAPRPRAASRPPPIGPVDPAPPSPMKPQPATARSSPQTISEAERSEGPDRHDAILMARA